MSTKTANWNFPTTFWFGNGRIKDLIKGCEQLNIKKPLFVTDEGLVDLDVVKDTTNILKNGSMEFNVYSHVQGNPTGKNVMDGVTIFKENNHDGVIAFGGGSALDAAKAIALMAGQTRSLWDFEDVGDNWTRVNADGIAPILAVPTTAGTGSEAGRASVITDEEAKVKKIIFHPGMLPGLVISDPELTVGLPPNLTAWTGVDAFVHAFEAYCAPGYHPIAEGIAIEAMRLIAKYLPIAYADGANLEARGQMLTASSMGAIAFQKGLGSIHSVAHSLGALYNTQHGLTNAILFPYGIKQNASAIEEKMVYLAQVLGIKDKSVNGVIDFILDFRKQLNIPNQLSELGIDDKIDIGEKAFNDPSTPTNAKPVTAGDLQNLFIAALVGDLEALK
jgi:alcohol dehydrogenase class IV